MNRYVQLPRFVPWFTRHWRVLGKLQCDEVSIVLFTVFYCLVPCVLRAKVARRSPTCKNNQNIVLPAGAG